MSTIAAPSTVPRATLADLAKTEGKAELINGKIVHFMATGHRPNRVAFRIARSLDDYAESTGNGYAYGDNMGFAVPMLSTGRESFSPDASWFPGPAPANKMTFVKGPPAFAVEVRSETDYGPAGDAAIAPKRAEYFEAGTEIVWDVDPKADLIRSYSRTSPDQPVIYTRGDTADAKPIVPSWTLDVAHLFRP